MATPQELIRHVYRLVRLVRSAQMKRVLSAIDPDPALNFWRVIHGDELDIAVLEWCKIFGTNTEPTHWKSIVPANEQAGFRTAMLAALGIDDAAWADYWEQMKVYRDNRIAHHIETPDVTHYPVLDLALRSSYFYYEYVIRQLRALGETRFQEDLQHYADAFEAHTKAVAQQAIDATAGMKERVY